MTMPTKMLHLIASMSMHNCYSVSCYVVKVYRQVYDTKWLQLCINIVIRQLLPLLASYVHSLYRRPLSLIKKVNLSMATRTCKSIFTFVVIISQLASQPHVHIYTIAIRYSFMYIQLLHGIATYTACIRMQCVSILGHFGSLALSLMGHWVIWVSKCDLVATLVEKITSI